MCGPKPSLQDNIAAAFRTWLSTNSITNASLAVIQNGQLIRKFGFGNRTSTTVVPIASLTKAITGTCIANLVDAGTDKNTTIADAHANNITIEHLLRHTSGFPGTTDREGHENGIGSGRSSMGSRHHEHSFSGRDVCQSAAVAKSHWSVGDGVMGANDYNNVNYALLGMIINRSPDRPARRIASRRRSCPSASMASRSISLASAQEFSNGRLWRLGDDGGAIRPISSTLTFGR
jgi:CubicO group peptidase (beta-lactamase class C family)